jgi:hypothetical protein
MRFYFDQFLSFLDNLGFSAIAAFSAFFGALLMPSERSEDEVETLLSKVVRILSALVIAGYMTPLIIHATGWPESLYGPTGFIVGAVGMSLILRLLHIINNATLADFNPFFKPKK